MHTAHIDAAVPNGSTVNTRNAALGFKLIQISSHSFFGNSPLFAEFRNTHAIRRMD